MAQSAFTGATSSRLKHIGALCLSFSLAACASTPSPSDAKMPATTPDAVTTPVPDQNVGNVTREAITLPALSLPAVEREILSETPPATDLLIAAKDKGRSKAPAPTPGKKKPTPAQPGSACRSSIMMDMNGQVLMGHNQDTKRYPASVTKTMTLIMVFDAIERGELKLTDKITFSAHAASRERTNLGLSTGSKVTVEDGIKALVVHSANDMATAFGEHLAGGSEARFARMMTSKALSIGMKDTVFKNASGLPNAEMTTTAYDMALMSKYLVQNYPNEYHYFATRSFTYNGTTYRNHNPSLRTYPGVDGIKTGFTRASLFNIAVSAKRPEGRLVVTLFGCPSTPIRTREVESMLNRGFEILRKRDKTTAIEAPAPEATQIEPAVISLNKAYQPRPTAR